jgi:hypothetical protein
MIARVPHLVRVENSSEADAGESNASFRGEDPVRAEAAPAASRPEGVAKPSEADAGESNASFRGEDPVRAEAAPAASRPEAMEES